MEKVKRTNIGYEIIESCNIGSTEIVIGYNPDESAVPYVCWYCKGGNDYYWGKYCATLQAAREKLIERYQRESHIAQKTEVKEKQCNFIVVSEKNGCFHFVGAFECKYDATKAMVADFVSTVEKNPFQAGNKIREILHVEVEAIFDVVYNQHRIIKSFKDHNVANMRYRFEKSNGYYITDEQCGYKMSQNDSYYCTVINVRNAGVAACSIPEEQEVEEKPQAICA